MQMVSREAATFKIFSDRLYAELSRSSGEASDPFVSSLGPSCFPLQSALLRGDGREGARFDGQSGFTGHGGRVKGKLL